MEEPATSRARIPDGRDGPVTGVAQHFLDSSGIGGWVVNY